ncbi:MAG: helix-turn-helix domain-containing protein [Halieaceae bacterium]|jgi:putative transcriptional regulator|nr:helix-turn-helix domain-containing protein [Halieaceae bacterium]
MYHYESCGLENVWLKNGYTESTTKYGDGVSINDVEGLHCALALEIVHLPRPITAREFRFLRIELDLSQRQLAGLMGLTDQTIAKYEKGQSPITRLADTTLRNFFLESVNQESKVRDLLEELIELDNGISDLEREQETLELDFESGTWHPAAAA